MTKLLIICGHGDVDTGACAYGRREADDVRELARRMKAIGGDAVELYPMDHNPYAENAAGSALAYVNYRHDCDTVIELHRDCAGAMARGAHVAIKAGIGGPNAYDTALAGFLAGILPGRCYPVVEYDKFMSTNCAYRAGWDFRLVELGFISSATDNAIWDANLDAIAAGILGCFGITAGQPTAGGWSACDRDIIVACDGSDLHVAVINHPTAERVRVHIANEDGLDKWFEAKRGDSGTWDVWTKPVAAGSWVAVEVHDSCFAGAVRTS